MIDVQKVIAHRNAGGFRKLLKSVFNTTVSPENQADLNLGATLTYLQTVNTANERYSAALAEAIEKLETLAAAQNKMKRVFQALQVEKRS